MNHIVIFTLGPVQSFIAQARKTQDLYAGSLLLAALARQTYEQLTTAVTTKSGSVELIFPAFYDQDGTPVSSNPNRFAATVQGISATELQTICTQTKAAINQQFTEQAITEILPSTNNGKTIYKLSYHPSAQPLEDADTYQDFKTLAENQLQQHLEIYWAAAPYTQENYEQQYENLEKYISSLKNTRQYEQSNEQAGRKCNIDGYLNALFVKHANDSSGKTRENPPSFIGLNNTPYTRIGDKYTRLLPGEGLSAISMYKRRYQENKIKGFPSTAEIALMQKISEVESHSEWSGAYQDYKNLFWDEEWDEQQLFEENLSRKYMLKHGMTHSIMHRERIVEQFNSLSKAVGGFHPSYYAILLFDGDRMGQWFQGNHLVEGSSIKAFHQDFKDILRDFAAEATRMLNEGNKKGITIYAGGDDFLGLLNLHHLIPVLIDLRAAFDTHINQILKTKTVAADQYAIKSEAALTFSAGVAIAHYKQPLNIVLDMARTAESNAKKYGGDHVAFDLLRHAGKATQAVLSFGRNAQNLNALNTVIQQLRDKKFSNQFITNITTEARYWNDLANRAILDTELERLILRAKSSTKDKVSTQDQSEFLAAIATLTNKPTTNETTTITQAQITNLLALLNLTDFITRNTKNKEA